MEVNIDRASVFMLQRRNEDGMTDLSVDEGCCDLSCGEGQEKGVCGAEGFGFGAGPSRCSI
jgi:hypothetical protein